MSCAQTRQMLDAWLDDELDAATSAQIAAHIKTCADCAFRQSSREQLRATLRRAAPAMAAPAALREAVQKKIHVAERAELEKGVEGVEGVERAGLADPAHRVLPALPSFAPTQRFLRQPLVLWKALLLALGAGLAAALAMFTLVQAPQHAFAPQPASTLAGSERALPHGAELRAMLTTRHAASLASPELVAVVSSDRHTVKPWFQGKLDFAPPVKDLSAGGFALLGARIDALGPQPAAALVYKIRKHPVNLFVWPAPPGQAMPPEFALFRGFAVGTWTEADLNYAAVADTDLAELQRFARQFGAPLN